MNADKRQFPKCENSAGLLSSNPLGKLLRTCSSKANKETDGVDHKAASQERDAGSSRRTTWRRDDPQKRGMEYPRRQRGDTGRTGSTHCTAPSLAPSETPAAHTAQGSPPSEPARRDRGRTCRGIKEGTERARTGAQPLSAPSKPRKTAPCRVLRRSDRPDGCLEIPHQPRSRRTGQKKNPGHSSSCLLSF